MYGNSIWGDLFGKFIYLYKGIFISLGNIWSGDIYFVYDIGMWGLVLYILFSLFFLYKVEEII